MQSKHLAVLLVLCMLSMACSAWAEEKKPEDIELSVIFLDVTVEFAQFIKAGVDAAAKEFGIAVNFDGPVDYGLDQQIAIIEHHLSLKPDGIAIAALSSEDIAPLIVRALDSGIPVVTYNSDAATSRRMAYYGQNLKDSGRAQATYLLEYMGEEGQVLIVTVDALAAWSFDREEGNRDVYSKYPAIEVIGVIDGKGDVQTIYEPLEQVLEENPNITGIASLDALTTPVVGEILLKHHLQGKIKHVGHDLAVKTLENIISGATNATLGQNPYLQGYLAVKSLFEYLLHGKEPQSEDTGVLRVDQKNVKEYLERIKQGDNTLG